jgi:hypothetical protein
MKKFLFIAVALLGAYAAVAQTPMSVRTTKKKCGAVVTNLLNHGIDTSDSRGVADNYYLWRNGSTITVKFMGPGSERIRNMVIRAAKEWEKHGNVVFNFVPDASLSANIRIKLGNGEGHNSAVGTTANLKGQLVETMNLDTADFINWKYYMAESKANGKDPAKMTDEQWKEFILGLRSMPNPLLDTVWAKGTVMHEFGHALGLLHEQSYPGGVKWKKTPEAYKYYLETQGWTKEDVDFQVFEVSDVFYTNGTSYDPKSIMHYSIDAWQTEDGYSVGSNSFLSEGDKKLISILYPKGKTVSDREVPKVDVKNMGKMEIYSSTQRNGLVIYPKFTVNTNSKVGQVYYVARLVDESNQLIQDTDDKYNWGGFVATYVKATLLPDTKMAYNQGTEKNLELFLPYSQIPPLNGKKVYIVFTVVLDDVVNGQYDKLMYFTNTGYLSLPK